MRDHLIPHRSWIEPRQHQSAEGDEGDERGQDPEESRNVLLHQADFPVFVQLTQERVRCQSARNENERVGVETRSSPQNGPRPSYILQ